MPYEIHPLRLADCETDTSFLVWGLTPGTRMTVPITAYLILGGEAPVLVDAGRRMDTGREEVGTPVFTRTPEQALDAVLAEYGLRPEDIGRLVMTHLHGDHTGAVDAFPNARISLQRRELQYAAAPYHPVRLYDRVDIGKLIGPLFDRIDFLEGDETLAPGLHVRWTGGHSPGHQQVEIELESGPAVITGDNVYLVDPGLKEDIPPGYVTSVEETMRALARIRREAVHVLPMHDPEVHRLHRGGLR